MRTGKRKKYRWRPLRTVAFLAAVIVLMTVVWQGKDVAVAYLQNNLLGFADTFSDADPSAEALLSTDGLYSPNAILIRLSDQKVLLAKAPEEKIYPASLTKIMTVLVAMEMIDDPDETVELPESIFPDLYASDASMAGFMPGERVPVKDLFYGALLPSGADASLGLAIASAGSEQRFVGLMNEKAEALGMKDTHFANVTGLHDQDHYTTAKDLSILLENALENKNFREVFTSKSHRTEATECHPGGLTLESTLFSELKTDEIEGGRILGGKTGYTPEAGLCLASLAEKNGEEYILVTAGADGDHSTEQFDITDAYTIFREIE